MNVQATLANTSWLATCLPAWRRFKKALSQPDREQSRILSQFLARNASSAFGRTHGAVAIRCYQEFAERIPLGNPADLGPWVKRIMLGEKSVLTAEPVTRLIPTSGSTGGSKWIPFTASFQKEVNQAISPWVTDMIRSHPSMILGTSYWSVSPGIPAPDLDSAIPIGFDDDSEYVGGIRKHWVEMALSVPSSVRLIRNFENWRYITSLHLLRDRNLRLISVWHPSFLGLLLDFMIAHWNDLLCDIAQGVCRPPNAEQAYRAPANRTRNLHRALPKRAQELKHLPYPDPRSIWPHLRVISCWADSHATLAANALQSRFSHCKVMAKGLIATEGFISLPFEEHHPLAIQSHFLEFMDSQGRIHLAHELEKGSSYNVLLTTGAGLWRYQLGDKVRVDGFLGHTPSIRFMGRGEHVSDLCGEKLEDTFVTQAVAEVCMQMGQTPRLALIAPEHDGRQWHYTLFTDAHPLEPLRIDLELRLRANPHYALCRDLNQLGPLRAVRTPENSYELLLRNASEKGQIAGQLKPKTLSTQTDIRNCLQISEVRSMEDNSG